VLKGQWGPAIPKRQARARNLNETLSSSPDITTQKGFHDLFTHVYNEAVVTIDPLLT
jgi:hypothetical protein